MAINKVVYGNQTLMDLTSDTVTEQDVAQGVTFHDASGALRTGSASGGSGHIIEDASGTDLTQRSKLQFIGGLKAIDDSTNGKTVVDDSATEITFTQWNNMTPEQQAAIPKALITDVPSVDGGIQADLMTKLWENPSPTSSFASQTVTLASDDYDFLLFIHRANNGSTAPCNSLIVPKGQSGNFAVAGTSSNGVIGNDRRITYTDDTHIAYGDNNYCYGTNATSVSNTRNIPYLIYGIKKTINLEFSAIASGVSTSADKCMLEDEVTSMQDVTDSIAPTDTTPATAAHAIGEQFYFNGQLVTATAAIAIGDTIAVGTNCTTSGTVTEQIHEEQFNVCGTTISLLDYTSSNKYRFPYDGYCTVYATSAGAYARLRLADANGVNMGIVKSIYNNADARATVFVRKGMQAYVDQATGSSGSYAVSYWPLTSYAE